jgi:hypothetical protein
MEASSGWTSVEIAKLTVGALTPLTVALIGVWLARVTRRVEASQWVNQKLIEKRVGLLERALPELNDLYCYFLCIGQWKEISPPEVLDRKRRLDRLFYANRSFFSAATLADYEAFSAVLFKTYAAPGKDARLRTGMVSRHGNRAVTYRGRWKRAWAAMFAEEAERTGWDTVRERYDGLMARLGVEVGAEAGTGARRGGDAR